MAYGIDRRNNIAFIAYYELRNDAANDHGLDGFITYIFKVVVIRLDEIGGMVKNCVELFPVTEH